jgi:hypothetical protein
MIALGGNSCTGLTINVRACNDVLEEDVSDEPLVRATNVSGRETRGTIVSEIVRVCGRKDKVSRDDRERLSAKVECLGLEHLGQRGLEADGHHARTPDTSLCRQVISVMPTTGKRE